MKLFPKGVVMVEAQPNEGETEKVAAFRQLCQAHDLTYQYSDDNRVWVNGQQERKCIEAAALLIDRETAVKIFNESVDAFLVPEAREGFYWK